MAGICPAGFPFSERGFPLFFVRFFTKTKTLVKCIGNPRSENGNPAGHMPSMLTRGPFNPRTVGYSGNKQQRDPGGLPRIDFVLVVFEGCLSFIFGVGGKALAATFVHAGKNSFVVVFSSEFSRPHL